MMNVINLTPHEINFIGAGDKPVTRLESSGVARINQNNKLENYYKINGEDIPFYECGYGAVSGLPEEKAGIFYIVSLPVATALKDFRKDLLIVQQPVRNKKGQVIGCRALGKVI